MSPVELRPRAECGYDQVSLGEVMLRLDPGELRVRSARTFTPWAGGGEYNVARGLSRCFGQRTAVVTALADNEVGHLIEDGILQGGVDTQFISWLPYDGIGRGARNGLNFTERGFGVRGALGVSDRGHTAASMLRAGEVDWEDLFGRIGVRWFHTGGIYAGLSETTAEVIEEAMLCARRHGTVVSFDLNYRPSLWKAFGGQEKAQAVNRRLARHVDVMVGNEEDFTASLGFVVPGGDEGLSSLDVSGYTAMIEEAVREYPNFKVVGTTLRTVRSASVNDWGAIVWADGTFHETVHRPGLEILDRVGGGDSFMSGLIYGLLDGRDVAQAAELGAAHGALAMTTPGDVSMAALADVENLARGASARVQR
ncbi:MAG: kinase, pfkB family protein [Nocardioides sp.]|nr:kinase, pfkB family protein [Nocardioides sp.]